MADGHSGVGNNPASWIPPAGAAVVSAAAVLVLGLLAGYRDPRSYVLFGLLTALMLTTAANFGLSWFPDEPPGQFAVRVAILAFGVTVLCGLLLGWVRQISIGGYLSVQAAIFAASLAARARRAGAVAMAEPGKVPVWTVGVVGALAAFAIAFAAGNAPLTLYDAVSYHLHFAARWLQERTLSIVPTPFSDIAQAYAPADGELWFLWLMMPFHGDFLARFGQLPFAAIGSVTLFLLARRLGAPAHHAIYPATFFLLSRPILEQAIGADVDLVCATMFLAAVYFGMVAVESNRPRDWIFWGVTLGLYFGSKYVALVYTPVLLLLAVVRRPRLRMAWALAGVVLFAAPWYVRNWIVAGSPIYPASLELGGITLARGAFTHGAMLNTVFHTTDASLIPTMAARAFGPTLFVVWLPVAIVGGIRLARRGWWPHGFIASVPLLMAPLYWFGFPVNVDPRFFMPAVAPALLPFAFTFRGEPRTDRMMHALYTAAIAWILIGSGIQIAPRVPWFMRDWWALNGLVTLRFVGWFAAIAIAVAAAWRFAADVRVATALTTIVVAVSIAILAIAGESRCIPSRCDYLDVTPPFIRSTLVDAWRWSAEHVKHSTVAYTGINLPYPLTGPQLANRVIYVNTDGHQRWRFHDYDRAYRNGRFVPSGPPLATSSGELMPVAERTGPRQDALRPRYERMQGSRDAWMASLRRLAVDHLFVASLSAYEIDHVWHNEGGFPIEDEWASADPQVFRLEYANPQVHMYAVSREATP